MGVWRELPPWSCDEADKIIFVCTLQMVEGEEKGIIKTVDADVVKVLICIEIPNLHKLWTANGHREDIWYFLLFGTVKPL